MNSSLAVLSLVVWYISLAICYYRSKRTFGSAGLVFTYLACTAVIVVPGATFGVLDWLVSDTRPDLLDGLPISALMPVGLLAGHGLMALFRSTRPTVHIGQRGRVSQPSRVWSATTWWTCFVSGLVLYTVGHFALAGIPTLSTLPSVGLSIAVAGLVGVWWHRFRSGRKLGAWLVLPLAALFPAVTLLGHGFLSYAVLPLVLTIAFVASMGGDRQIVTVVLVLATTAGVVSFPTYFKFRERLRASVWGGEGVSERVDTFQTTMVNGYVGFDRFDSTQMRGFDGRLNHGVLYGQIKWYMATRGIPHARGETFGLALIAPIPRVIWPDKPQTSGGSALVTQYTGVVYNDVTSVGITHTGELYVNFGLAGVFFGGLLFGCLLTWADRVTVVAAQAGDALTFFGTLIVVQALMGVTSGFSEAVGATAVALVCYASVWVMYKLTQSPTAPPYYHK